MPNLPIFQSDNTTLTQMQTKWKSEITPVITNEINQGQLLTGIAITAGDNAINHKLSRMMVGWYIVDQDGAATFYRSKPLSTTTLTLNSTAACTVAIWVF